MGGIGPLSKILAVLVKHRNILKATFVSVTKRSSQTGQEKEYIINCPCQKMYCKNEHTTYILHIIYSAAAGSADFKIRHDVLC